MVIKFGHQGFKSWDWKLVGRLKDFKREDWPVPVFYHHTAPFKPELVFLNDELDEIDRKNVDNSVIPDSYPRTGTGGSVFIQNLVLKLIERKV